MHPELAKRFDERIRDEAALRYGVDPSDLARLNAFENFVFECTHPDGVEMVLRISHSSRRTVDYTLGEVELVRFFAAAGIPVAAPLLADSGHFVEKIDDGHGGYFVATAFERAPGHVFDDAPPLREKYWKPELFRELGVLFGKMHERARAFRPSSPRTKRIEWHEYDVVDIDALAPKDETLVRERTSAILTRLRKLPTGEADYGVIHADLHPHNFCFDEGKITVFDFDNAEYAWFAKDVAVILFYVARAEEAAQRDHAAAAFLAPFLAGYREVRPLERGWIEAIPDMLALQRSMNYALFHQTRDPETNDEATMDAWRRFRRDIEADTPVLKLDFGGF